MNEINYELCTGGLSVEIPWAGFLYIFCTMEERLNNQEERMKKRVFKRKKNVIVRKVRRAAGRAALWAAAAGLVLSVPAPAYGKENPKSIVTHIYHRHVGNGDTQGGCYGKAIEHIHQGSRETGGACYQIQVPHTHQGSEEAGGGCYTVPITHTHKGNKTQGGECYVPDQIHNHTESCYESGKCTVYFTQESVIETLDGDCPSHQKTTLVRAGGTEVHENCGKGTITGERLYCQSCGVMPPTRHSYKNEICGLRDGQVLEYRIDCGKKIDGYKIGCGKKNGGIDHYDRSCEKEVDGYEMNCGLTEEEPCGRLILSNETEGKGEQVTLKVCLEDLTGGKLKPAENPFCWLNEQGEEIGAGDQVQVTENGTYGVRVRLKNEDVDPAGLCSSILVDNIYKEEAPVVSPSSTPSAMPTDTPQPSAVPSAKPSVAPTAAPEKSPSPGNTPEPSVLPAKSPDPVNTPAPSRTPETVPEISEGSGGNDTEQGGAEEEEKTEEVPQADKKQPSPTPGNPEVSAEKETGSLGRKRHKASSETEQLPVPEDVQETEPMVKEMEEISLPEVKTEGTLSYQVHQKEKPGGFFALPAVKIISITTGSVLLFLGLLLLLLYLRRSVKIYNDDGEGRMLYLGRCPVRKEEELYEITLEEQMIERAYTNRYCIKPGLFKLGKKEGTQLAIHKEGKTLVLVLSREMIAVF